MDYLFLASAITAGLLATSFGGVFIFLFREKYHSRALDIANAFAAGIMLAASIFSLLLPGLEWGGLIPVVIGFIVGILFILLLKDRIHVFYYRLEKKSSDPKLRRALLIFIALTLHNMPEGMAVGIAFASGSMLIGMSVAMAIGIQNIPEGFAIAAPLVATGEFSKKSYYSKKKKALLTFI